LQSFGATEALPPEDADMIVDNTATGTTLRANRLVEVEVLMCSNHSFLLQSGRACKSRQEKSSWKN